VRVRGAGDTFKVEDVNHQLQEVTKRSLVPLSRGPR
jgi:hypothetical protein